MTFKLVQGVKIVSTLDSCLQARRYVTNHFVWGDPDVDGRIILRWIFRKWEGVETGWGWLRIETGGGHL